MLARSIRFQHFFSLVHNSFLFTELLSQKHKSNKMSAQNIAIVMSPNLLWSPETSDVDYVSKVNSTASVNTIVEAIVSDWSYFFDDEFTVSDFYVTLSRDELFPHNGGFPVDRDSLHAPVACDNIMTKSLNIVTNNNEMIGASSSGSSNHLNESFGSVGSGYQTHSRSSSHDTSLILVDSGLSKESRIKRSQSNSSLSDSSPPQQGSPKLPVRRKHNKQIAPTPPDNRFQRASDHYASINSGHNYDNVSMKERFFNAGNHQPNDAETNRVQSTVVSASNVFKHPAAVSMRQCHGSQENLTSKPDKPPRPTMPIVESQTLIRNAFKAKGLDRNGRPVALPRNILNVARSTENLSMSSNSSPSPVKTSPGLSISAQNRNDAPDDAAEIVLLRDANCSPTENIRSGDKPAIPERPTSLMKSNFRTAIFDKFESNPSFPSQLSQTDQVNGSIKKTQSFRMSTGNGNRDSKGIAVGSITGRSLTTLERTHIYNVDKQQVAFIDVSDQQPNSASTPPSQGSPKQNTIPNGGNGGEKDVHLNGNRTSNENQSASTENLNVSGDNVPHSPRCFEPKVIKRPQIPAPPPPKVNATASSGEPTNHVSVAVEQINRKSDGNLSAEPVAVATTNNSSTTTTPATVASGDSTNL